MRRELVREADLGAQIADESDQQDFQRQADGTRRATGEFLPRPVRSIRDGPCHSGTSLAACLIVISGRSGARVRSSTFYSPPAKLPKANPWWTRRRGGPIPAATDVAYVERREAPARAAAACRRRGSGGYSAGRSRVRRISSVTELTPSFSSSRLRCCSTVR